MEILVSDRTIVEELIRRVVHIHYADFYLSQWQKDGETRPENFNDDVYKAASCIYSKLTREEKEALFACVPRGKSHREGFGRTNEALQKRFNENDFALATFLYYIYVAVAAG